MKNYIKFLMIAFFLNFSIATFSMEESSVDKNEYQNTVFLGLPTEIWIQILNNVYEFDSADTIYKAVKKAEYTIYSYKMLSLVCKDLKALIIPLDKFKEELKIFKNILKEKYLEKRFNGLFPKGQNWFNDLVININTAIFIASDRVKNDFDLTDAIMLKISEPVLSVLLFFGANPNYKRFGGPNLLCTAIRAHHSQQCNNLGKILLLLKYGADPTIRVQGKTLMSIAMEEEHHDIAALLQLALNQRK